MLQYHVSCVVLATRAAPHPLTDCKQPVYSRPQSLKGGATEECCEPTRIPICFPVPSDDEKGLLFVAHQSDLYLAI